MTIVLCQRLASLTGCAIFSATMDFIAAPSTWGHRSSRTGGRERMTGGFLLLTVGVASLNAVLLSSALAETCVTG